MSITDVSDNSFIIKRPFDENGHNYWIDHIGCKWEFGYSSPLLYLRCIFNQSKLWNINAQLTFTISKANGETVEKKEEAQFNCDISRAATEIILDEWEDVNNIECLVEIKSSTAIYYKTRVFNKKTDANDTALIVEGNELFISKQILANASPVFHAMFYSGFKESTADKIPIQDVKYEDMEQFLKIIYGRFQITGSNVDSLLKLADRFDVCDVTQKCEEYLIKATDVSNAKKLIYAEDYRLSELQSHVFKNLTLEELKEFGWKSDQFSEATAKELYRLSVKHMRPEHKQPETGFGRCGFGGSGLM